MYNKLINNNVSGMIYLPLRGNIYGLVHTLIVQDGVKFAHTFNANAVVEKSGEWHQEITIDPKILAGNAFEIHVLSSDFELGFVGHYSIFSVSPDGDVEYKSRFASAITESSDGIASQVSVNSSQDIEPKSSSDDLMSLISSTEIMQTLVARGFNTQVLKNFALYDILKRIGAEAYDIQAFDYFMSTIDRLIVECNGVATRNSESSVSYSERIDRLYNEELQTLVDKWAAKDKSVLALIPTLNEMKGSRGMVLNDANADPIASDAGEGEVDTPVITKTPSSKSRTKSKK